MLYMSSTASSTGSYSLTVTFKVGTDPDIAQVNTQNRVTQALAQLPSQVQNLGVTVQAESTNLLLVIPVYSPDASKDVLFLSNFATINVQNELARVDGVGNASQFGPMNYSMRVWLKSERMAALGITPQDVRTRSSSRTSRPRWGRSGVRPSATIRPSRTPSSPRGSWSRRRSSARSSCAPAPTAASCASTTSPGLSLAPSPTRLPRYNGEPAAAIAIYQAPGANALAVVKTGQGATRGTVDALPRWRRRRCDVRLDTVRAGVDPRDHRDPGHHRVIVLLVVFSSCRTCVPPSCRR
jgi:multidrug efflux pump subunit AcrB